MKTALDSNTLTYLLNITHPDYEEGCCELEEVYKMVLRSFLYQKDLFYLPPTVVTEYKRIRKNNEKRKKHDVFAMVNMLDILGLNQVNVNVRADEFNKHHKGGQDCSILAECEEGKIDYLLTYDGDFYKDLVDKTQYTKLLFPSDYWALLAIPKRSEPTRVPHASNPLLQKSHLWAW
ncbi:MAG: type II toxin-antitoxin system VapC family toxin [bacterium]